MKATERIYNFFKGKEIDRLPMIEWAPIWGVTLDRWKTEGLKTTGNDFPSLWRNIQLELGLDANFPTYIMPRTPGICPVAPTQGAGIMKTEQDYQQVKKYMFANPELLLRKEHIEWMQKTRDAGDTIHWFTLEGFFWYPREMFGIEAHLYSFYDQPELYHQMCEDYVEWLKKVIEYIGNNFRFDFMTFEEDMSYNNGPMISESLFDEFLAPYYKKIIPLIQALDIPVIIDSDGDITKAVDWYAKVNVNGFLPLERQAGVDVSLYLNKQPDKFFIGHFDKTCMKYGEKAMRDEFERIYPSMLSKRFIPSVDHQTPPDVSLENYKTYVRLLKEYTEKASKEMR